MATPTTSTGAAYIRNGITWTDTTVGVPWKNEYTSTLSQGFSWIAWGID